jgi:hypothetical protein
MPRIEELKRLLDRIAQTTSHYRIEIDYNGVDFKWKVPQHNVTAEELIVRNLKSRSQKC